MLRITQEQKKENKKDHVSETNVLILRITRHRSKKKNKQKRKDQASETNVLMLRITRHTRKKNEEEGSSTKNQSISGKIHIIGPKK